MNKNDQQFLAQRIRAQYVEKKSTQLDELRALDGKVKRPACVFSYVFGSIGAVIMGAGMSLVMTDIGATLGITATMGVGVAVGILGLVAVLANYPIYRHILKKRKQKYGAEIFALSEEIMNK